MAKKGQITFFILIGIVIVIIGGFFFYLNNVQEEELGYTIEDVQKTPTEMQPIKNFVDECIKRVAMPGLDMLGMQGGYISPEAPYFVTEKYAIAYHYYNGENKSPTLYDMENQLSIFIGSALPLCIDDFKQFQETGKDIRAGSIYAKINIGENEVILEVDYPISIKKDEKTVSINKFIHKIPIRLGHIYTINQQIIGQIKNNPKAVDFAFLSQHDLKVTLLPHSDDTIVYTLHDSKSRVDNQTYLFMFANKIELNSAPELDFIPDFVTTKGKAFTYDVNANDFDDDIVRYFAETTLFDIDETSGIINFIPEYSGDYDVEIIAKDSKGNSDEQKVHFKINNE
jgi:hypothetical protein